MKVELLKNLCHIIGGNPAPNEFPVIKNGLPFIKMKDLGRYHLTNNLVEIENIIEPNNKFKLIKKGSILLPRSGSVGLNHRAILGRDSYMVSHICALEVLDKNLLFNGFLYYYLTTVDMKRFLKKTTGLDAITFESLGKIQIPLPPLPEQKRITEILDKADALRQKNKQLLATYDELLQATFLDMFGDPVTNPKRWERKLLYELVDKSVKYSLSSGPFGSSLTSVDYVDDGVPILRGVNVSNGYLDMTNVKFISEVKAKELVRSEIHPGDLVIIAVGSSGKALMIPNSLKRAIMSQNFNKITVNQKIVLPIFLEFSLNDRDIQQQIKRKMSDTVRTFFSLTNMKELQVICPPISLQNQFAQIVENIEAQKTMVKQSSQESDDLFNGLVQKAFGSEL